MLFNGNCLEVMKTLDDKSIDLVFCDLPYGQTNCKWDCKIDLVEFWKQIMRIKKLNTPLFFTTTTKFGVELINSAPKKCFFRYDLVWVKSACSSFLTAKKMPMRKHEMVYVFYEKLPFYDLSRHTHKFISGASPQGQGAVKKEESMRPTDKYKNQSTMYGNIDRPDFKRKDGESMYNPPLPTTMLEIKSTSGKHSTEKPVALMEWILSYYSKEGDIILDPTMGSGSTGVACKNLNRKFIGIELDQEIFEVAKGRNPHELIKG